MFSSGDMVCGTPLTLPAVTLAPFLTEFDDLSTYILVFVLLP